MLRSKRPTYMHQRPLRADQVVKGISDDRLRHVLVQCLHLLLSAGYRILGDADASRSISLARENPWMLQRLTLYHSQDSTAVIVAAESCPLLRGDRSYHVDVYIRKAIATAAATDARIPDGPDVLQHAPRLLVASAALESIRSTVARRIELHDAIDQYFRRIDPAPRAHRPRLPPPHYGDASWPSTAIPQPLKTLKGMPSD